MNRVGSWFLISIFLTVWTIPVRAEELNAEGMGSAEMPSITTTASDYNLQPNDVIQVNVYEEPELTTAVRVSSQGEINYPLLGTINVTGYTVGKLRDELTRLLEADYLVNPQVQVYIQDYHSRKISVTGAVNKPGSFQIPVDRPTTMMEAIAMAGGFSKIAAMNKVRIIRTENGKPITIEVNAKDITKKGDQSKDVELLPSDVVFVPESWL